MNLSSNLLTGNIPASIATNLTTLAVPGGFRVCSNPGITINGLNTEQPGDPVYDFVVLRDPEWNTTCT
jgi:hypothetical protein